MIRKVVDFKIEQNNNFKQKALHWAQKESTFIFLDSNNYKQQYSSFSCVLAVGNYKFVSMDSKNAFNRLEIFRKKTKDYIFGYLSYDLKNDTELIYSNNFDGLNFPELFFFQPIKLIFFYKTKIQFAYLSSYSKEIESDFKEIMCQCQHFEPKAKNVNIKSRLSRDEYSKKISQILEHIYRGDIYEATFCQEFYSKETYIPPLRTYEFLNQISAPPFACFMKNNHYYLISASPERFAKKMGNTVISQPIKGTARRGKTKQEDKQLKNALAKDIKELSENIMIVDLVRNDLSKMAQRGSVRVKNLCEIYTFPQVHQMISTIEAKISNKCSPVKIIKNLFPMGSMTGAPKLSAMKIIESLEMTKRGVFSGALGYFTPDGNFDFNVVIRSIIYNQKNKYVSFSVGGAITAKSIIDKEYEECMIKAKAIRDVLEGI